MIFKSLNDIPFGVYINYIINYIDIKEVGTLAMVSKVLNEVFSSNDIWKILYLRTTELKITENSIHIGDHDKSLSKNHLLEKYKVCKPCYWNPNYRQPISESLGKYLSLTTGCMCEINHNKLLEFKPLDNILLDHYDESKSLQEQPESVKQKYYDYCVLVHRNLNRRDGYNLVNLCRNKKHYISETLETSEVKCESKSYKKKTLEKYITKTKKKVGITSRSIEKNKYSYKIRIEKLRNLASELKQIKKEINEETLLLDKTTNLLNKSEEAVDLINQKLYPKKKKQKVVENNNVKNTLECSKCNCANCNHYEKLWKQKYPNYNIEKKDRWFRIYSKQHNTHYFHNHEKKESKWYEPNYWLDWRHSFNKCI